MTELMPIAGPTMKTVEIAELTGKQHFHVMRDTEKMFKILNLDASKFGCIYTDAKGRTHKCYELNKHLVRTLVTGYDLELRYKVMVRMDYLETQQSPFMLAGLPDINDQAALLRYAADQIEAKNQALTRVEEIEGELEKALPAVQTVNQLIKTGENLLIRDAAGALKMRECDLRDWLVKRKYIYRRGKQYRVYSRFKTAPNGSGLFAEKEREYKPGRFSHTPVITPKGLVYFEKKLAEERQQNPQLL